MGELCLSRRDFLRKSALAGAFGAAGPVLLGSAGTGVAAMAPSTQASSPNVPRAGRFLLKNGCVLSLDPKVGDFPSADVLIDGARIAEVRPSITAAGAQVIDCSNMIVMPGFVDTHRHMWLGPLRNLQPDGRLSDYGRDFNNTARKVYRPEDVYIGNLVSALGALNGGVTTIFDFSNISNTPAHSDAAIQGLRESGIRGVYGFGYGYPNAPGTQFPQDIKRLRTQYFSSDDQLLTLKIAANPNAAEWAAARDVGAPIHVHILGNKALLKLADAMGPDITYIHCVNLVAEEWPLIAKSGGSVSIACPIEMEMGHGVPPIQECLDHGIRPSLSTDVETQMPGEFFTQMRSLFTLQRMQVFTRERAGDKAVPRLLTSREVLEFATIEGARENHVDRKAGTLTPGKDADVLLLRVNEINTLPLNNAYGAVLLAMDSSNVDTVFVAGRPRKWQGRLVDVDLARIRKLAEASRDHIFAQTGWPRDILRGGGGFVS